ncbi:hypothetical protein [Endozoicomonas elysicola]|uniref:Uncharacterized protein n=1 Tax=Endozoicomonas elysicola TaxID=305900 RepID=A0A081KF47_9GAMM|nr:hypothetical protein [Endozoicomonas elysicola]KEI72773.1 hypothetical protein GV64_20390 [Endozoicomonas elysicola]
MNKKRSGIGFVTIVGWCLSLILFDWMSLALWFDFENVFFSLLVFIKNAVFISILGIMYGKSHVNV